LRVGLVVARTLAVTCKADGIFPALMSKQKILMIYSCVVNQMIVVEG
jgi:hypothetical protein